MATTTTKKASLTAFFKNFEYMRYVAVSAIVLVSFEGYSAIHGTTIELGIRAGLIALSAVMIASVAVKTNEIVRGRNKSTGLAILKQ